MRLIRPILSEEPILNLVYEAGNPVVSIPASLGLRRRAAASVDSPLSTNPFGSCQRILFADRNQRDLHIAVPLAKCNPSRGDLEFGWHKGISEFRILEFRISKFTRLTATASEFRRGFPS